MQLIHSVLVQILTQFNEINVFNLKKSEMGYFSLKFEYQSNDVPNIHCTIKIKTTTLQRRKYTFVSVLHLCFKTIQLNSSSASETPNGVIFAQIFQVFFVSHSLSAGCSHEKSVLSLYSIDKKVKKKNR